VLLHRFKTNPANEHWYRGSRTEEAARFPCKDVDIRVTAKWLDRKARGETVPMVEGPTVEAGQGLIGNGETEKGDAAGKAALDADRT
jgi:hypothetical protein